MLSRNFLRSARVLSRSTISTRFAPIAFKSLSYSTPNFSTTPLSTRLAEEIKFEAENGEVGEPEFLSDFKAAGVWTIEDKAGADEVALIRSYGNETIRVIFSIGDIDAEQDEEAFDEEVSEESADQGSGGEGDEKSGEDSEDVSFPVRAAITITKAGSKGALSIDAVAQDGLFTIDNISFYNDAAVAEDLTSEGDWKRRGLYIGPDFDNLDENVQAEFETFLEERGVDSSLALLIPDLAEHKEQKEYLTWLNSVKTFVEA